MIKHVLAGLLSFGVIGSLGTGLVAPAPAHAMPVFDSANYAQNLLTATRTLQQINQQIQSLQNEASMLLKMEKHLSRVDFPQLERIRENLRQVEMLMERARGIDFRVDQLDARLRAMYPRTFDQAVRTDERIRQARAQLDTSMDAFEQSMVLQAQVVENVRDDTQMLAEIVARSQGAEGSLQAQQATNQLLALTAKQQFQLQQLMAAQFREQTIEQARRVQGTEMARAATRRFLGSGSAYTSD